MRDRRWPPTRDYSEMSLPNAASSVTYSRMAIRDVDIPSEWQMRAILDLIASARAAGELVYVHCWGGVGRTGTVVGCMLREAGLPASEVLGEIARARAETARAGRESPETEAQRQFVTEWSGPDDRAIRQPSGMAGHARPTPRCH